MKFSFRPTIALSVTALLVLAACGGTPAVQPTATISPTATATAGSAATPTPQSTGATGGGACALVNQATAADALGEPVDGGTPGDSMLNNSTYCVYRATGSANWFKVELHPDAARSEWDDAMATLGMTAENAVEGIGEAAFRYSGASGSKITVFDAGHYIWVVINKAGDNTVFAAKVEQIARDILTMI